MGHHQYFNRDLSWLDFNDRVLHQALSKNNPLLERVRFLAIFSRNLDEFYMKRVGFLRRAVLKGISQVSIDRSRPGELLEQIRLIVEKMDRKRGECFLGEIIPDLKKKGIELLGLKDLSEKERERTREYFHNQVFPVLTPLAVDPAHPFPFLSNLSVSLGIQLHHPNRKERLFARIKIPNVLPQWVQLEGFRFVRLRDVIADNLSELFPEMVIEETLPFRVIRSADIEQDRDDIEDILDTVEEELRQRRKAEVVRMEWVGARDRNFDSLLFELLEGELDLDEKDFFRNTGELDFGSLFEISNLKIPHLRHSKWIPVSPRLLSDERNSIFKIIREQDILVHHPYESFSASVQRFVEEAVYDPKVFAIKVTFYRAGDESPLIPMLIEAAEKGKQVVCVVEVTARFDEAQNMIWAEILEKAGVHVVYGVVGLKTHAKTILVVRKEGENFNIYAHVGTGNYHAETSKLYTDFGLFTNNSKITSELVEVFNYLTGLSLKRNYKKLLVSPINMREGFSSMIEKEMENARKGKPAYIYAKMNSLEDSGVIDLLYDASGAGVKIDLLVRGFCCLRPKVKGLSENIRIFSIVGRFLEHSRVYYFQAGSKSSLGGKFFIGSADWMSRNLNSRVEVMVPVEDKKSRRKLWEMIEMSVRDQSQSWELQANGKYQRPLANKKSPGFQELLMEQAIQAAQERRYEHGVETSHYPTWHRRASGQILHYFERQSETSHAQGSSPNEAQRERRGDSDQEGRSPR